ncbi:ParA family protein, partial [Enterococcus faecium]|nr:ParA family protein [Enterococcus faecium]
LLNLKTITFFNNKGGVGKTTLVSNVSAYLNYKMRKKILVLDADPQANTTQMAISDEYWETYYGINPTRQTIKDLFMPIVDGEANIDPDIEITRGSEHNFLFDLIPGHPSLSMFEDVLSDSWAKSLSGDTGGIRKTNWLNLLKERYDNSYDFLIIDVGPSLGALNRSILLNSEYFMTPMGSDIFSLMSLSNISSWIKTWEDDYDNAIQQALRKNSDSLTKYPINKDTKLTTRYIGYSVQQYNARKFKDGKRPVKAYDNIIGQIHENIVSYLSQFSSPSIKRWSQLKLGDVPYLSSIIPMAQSTNTPLFLLTSKEGIRGGQGLSVIDATNMIDQISKNLLINIEGEGNERE